MRNTLERFTENIDGTLDAKIKLLCVYSIKFHLSKYVKFDDNEQKWYSENYPDDPSLQKQQSDSKDKDEEEEEKSKPKKIAINKYQRERQATTS